MYLHCACMRRKWCNVSPLESASSSKETAKPRQWYRLCQLVGLEKEYSMRESGPGSEVSLNLEI